MKTCLKCGIKKPLSDYKPSNIKKKDWRCRTCCQDRINKWKQTDKGKAAAKKYRLKKKKTDKIAWEKWVIDQGYTSCSMCGYNKCIAAIEFHHRDPLTKSFNVGNWMKNHGHNPKNINQLKKEISKCDVVCANCHRGIHNNS